MEIPLVVLHVDLADFPLSIDVILVDLPGVTSSQPAGRTVLTAAFSAAKRRADDLLTFFFCGVFDQNRSHDIPPVVTCAWNDIFSQQIVAKTRLLL